MKTGISEVFKYGLAATVFTLTNKSMNEMPNICHFSIFSIVIMSDYFFV